MTHPTPRWSALGMTARTDLENVSQGRNATFPTFLGGVLNEQSMCVFLLKKKKHTSKTAVLQNHKSTETQLGVTTGGGIFFLLLS